MNTEDIEVICFLSVLGRMKRSQTKDERLTRHEKNGFQVQDELKQRSVV